MVLLFLLFLFLFFETIQELYYAIFALNNEVAEPDCADALADLRIQQTFLSMCLNKHYTERPQRCHFLFPVVRRGLSGGYGVGVDIKGRNDVHGIECITFRDIKYKI